MSLDQSIFFFGAMPLFWSIILISSMFLVNIGKRASHKNY